MPSLGPLFLQHRRDDAYTRARDSRDRRKSHHAFSHRSKQIVPAVLILWTAFTGAPVSAEPKQRSSVYVLDEEISGRIPYKHPARLD